jgi:NADH dehydrogenase [ubiquinone] 1 alpha subcomplex assembly factor 2
MDVLRQERMRVLAAQSDARWAEKPSYLDAPVREGAGLKDSDGGQLAGVSDLDKASKVYNVDGGNVKNNPSKVVVTQEDILGHEKESTTKTNAKSDPWATSSKSRDEPQPWNPKIVKRR